MLTCDENGHECGHARGSSTGYNSAQDNLRHCLANTNNCTANHEHGIRDYHHPLAPIDVT